MIELSLVKITEFAEITKLTCLIREKTVTTSDFLLKQKKKNLRFIGLMIRKGGIWKEGSCSDNHNHNEKEDKI